MQPNSIITKPMLAGKVTDALEDIRYPCIVSPKLDGIRFLKIDGRGLSRRFKPIKNNYIRTTLERLCPDGIDGELMAGDTFQACTSAVMREDGEPDFKLWAFDLVLDTLSKPYCKRVDDLKVAIKKINDKRIVVVPVKLINSSEELFACENECLEKGFEGIMIRDPNGPYKCGRSTKKEGWLLKLKRFCDSEASIIGFEEQMHNANEAEVNELGHTQRSSAKAGKIPAGTLGNFIAIDEKNFPGVELHIGTGEGLTAQLRKRDLGAQRGLPRKTNMLSISRYWEQNRTKNSYLERFPRSR